MREPLTSEQKSTFLEHLAAGLKRNEAAALVGSTGSQFRKLTNPESNYYDASFASKYQAALDEHTENFQERVREEYVRRALQGGSDRLLDTLGKVTLPEMEVLQTQRIAIEGRVLVGRYFDLTQLEMDEIETLTRLLEKAQRRELPSGDNGNQ